MKIHNVFIEALGEEIQYYAALVRSLDSSLGNLPDSLAINMAKLQLEVHRHVLGPLTVGQTRMIAELLEQYKRRDKTPSIEDYQGLRLHILQALHIGHGRRPAELRITPVPPVAQPAIMNSA